MTLTSDIERAWSEGGSKAVITRSLKRLVRPAFKLGTLVFKECDLLQTMPAASPVPGIVVREARLEDASLFADYEVFLERMHDGRRCFIAVQTATDELANCRWINTSAAYIPELKRYVTLKSDEAYEFDIRTYPEFRRRGIDAYARHYVYSCLRNEGYARLFEYIHGDNYPSLKASRHLLTTICRVRYLQLRGCDPIVFGGRKFGFPAFSCESPIAFQ